MYINDRPTYCRLLVYIIDRPTYCRLLVYINDTPTYCRLLVYINDRPTYCRLLVYINDRPSYYVPRGASTLLAAARDGDIATVRRLLANDGVDVNMKDEVGAVFPKG